MGARPILLLASERSGSNLLRLMLGAHSRISAPPPAGHVLRVLGPLLHRYADAEGGLEIEALVDDAIALCRCHGQPWEIELDRERVLKRLPRTSLWDVFRVLFELHAEADGCDHWLAKDSRLFDHAAELRAALPDARFLYLARDGRDVACSTLASAAHAQHVYTSAMAWREEQRRCLRFALDPAAGRDVTFPLRYEDLVESPREILGEVCAFLELDFEERMLEFHAGAAARAAAGVSHDWQNLARPVMAGNHGKYRRELRAGQVRLFEQLAGAELEQLGYACDHAGAARIEDVRFVQRVLYEAIDRLRRRLRAARMTADEPFRRERARLVAEIRGRLRTRGPGGGAR